MQLYPQPSKLVALCPYSSPSLGITQGQSESDLVVSNSDSNHISELRKALMANLQLSNNMSGLSDHFILCKAMGDVPEDPCLLLRRDISFDEALDQIHRHWSLNVSLDTCDWKPDSPKPPSPHTDQYTLKRTIEIDSFRPRPSRPSEPSTLKLPFQHCSVELFVIGGGITARLLGLSWDMLRSKSIFNVIYWRLRPPRAIKAAGEMTSTTPMITAKAAATRATKGNIAGGEEDGMN